MAHSAIRRAAGVLAAVVILAGPIYTITPAAAEKVLRIANMAEPETLDPHRTSTVPESNILRNLFEGLMVLDPSGNVAPGVAENFSVSEDGLTYTFRLRANARWSNGEPVTAADFVYSLRRIEDPKTHSQYAEVLYPIKNAQEVNTGKAALTDLGAAAIDARTVEIALKAPTPYFLQLLTHTSSLPVNEREVTRFGEDWLNPGNMASNMASKRELLVEKITAGGQWPAYGFVPDGTANYTPRRVQWRTMSQAEREAAAQKLLREAGYGPNKPLRFELAYNTSENHKRIAIALAAMWKKINVSVELVNTEWKVHLNNLRIGNFQIGRISWIADYNDAQSFLLLSQTSTKQQNYSRFSNPEYDRLMDEASLTADARKRAALLEQAEGILLDELPVMPIYFYVSKNLVSTKIKGWQDNPLDSHYARDLSLAD